MLEDNVARTGPATVIVAHGLGCLLLADSGHRNPELACPWPECLLPAQSGHLAIPGSPDFRVVFGSHQALSVLPVDRVCASHR